jgi:hypothetical protein
VLRLTSEVNSTEFKKWLWRPMEWLKSLWFWIRENPGASIGLGILLFGAVGGLIKWCYEIVRARREVR